MLIFLAQTIASIGAALSAPSAYSVSPDMCSQAEGTEYCYYRGDVSSQRVVYFFHGFGDDVYGWTNNHSTGEIQKLWAQNSTPRPHVITLSRGVWWYTEKNHGRELTRFVEKIEGKHFTFTAERVLFGDSMGGHNAFRWVLDEPQLFQKVALICPAFPRKFVTNPAPSNGFPPWEYLGEQLINEFYKQSTRPQFNPIKPPTPGFLVGMLPTEVFLAATPRDQFGFYAGALALREELLKVDWLSLTYEEQNIDHCNLEDASAIADFLVQ